jgi:hypothetical protein
VNERFVHEIILKLQGSRGLRAVERPDDGRERLAMELLASVSRARPRKVPRMTPDTVEFR